MCIYILWIDFASNKFHKKCLIWLKFNWKCEIKSPAAATVLCLKVISACNNDKQLNVDSAKEIILHANNDYT